MWSLQEGRSIRWSLEIVFARVLSDLKLKRVPSEVVVVRSDDGGEFSEGKPGKLCRYRNIKQEFTTADSPENED